MQEDEAQDPDRYPPTDWSLIERIASGDLEALGIWYSLYKQLLLTCLQGKFRCSREQAEIWLHNFISDKIIEKNCLAAAQRERGQFRSFIVSVLKNYVIDDLRRSSMKEAEDPAPVDPAPVIYEEDIEWVRTILAEVLRRVQVHYEEEGKPEYWEIYRCQVVLPVLQGTDPVPYADFVQRYQFKSPQQAYNILNDGKRQFDRFLHEVVAPEHVGGQNHIQEELAWLIHILARFGAR